MKCLIIPRRHTIYSLLLPALFFLSLFSFSLLKSSSASAVDSSYSVTVDTQYQYICPENTPSCNSKRYMTFSCESYPGAPFRSSLSILIYDLSYNGSYNISLYPFYSNSLEIPAGYRFIQLTSISSFSSCTFDFYDEDPIGLPSGSLSITENGTYDVSSYAEAVVEVPNTETIVEGDYHDDLLGLKNAILIAIAVVIVFCFFKIILNMIMGVRR